MLWTGRVRAKASSTSWGTAARATWFGNGHAVCAVAQELVHLGGSASPACSPNFPTTWGAIVVVGACPSLTRSGTAGRVASAPGAVASRRVCAQLSAGSDGQMLWCHSRLAVGLTPIPCRSSWGACSPVGAIALRRVPPVVVASSNGDLSPEAGRRHRCQGLGRFAFSTSPQRKKRNRYGFLIATHQRKALPTIARALCYAWSRVAARFWARPLAARLYLRRCRLGPAPAMQEREQVARTHQTRI